MTKAVLALVACGVVSVIATSALAIEITRGPYLQSVTTDSIVIAWEQDEPGGTSLHYGLDETRSERVDPAVSGNLHVVQLTGLSAETRYFYAVHAVDGQLSLDHRFDTAVGPDTPFRFIAMGDTRSFEDDHQDVVDAMVDEGVAFYLNSGDLVSDGEEREQWDDYFAIEQPLMGDVTLFPVIGNHDEHDGNADLYINQFFLPTNSPAAEHYYSFDYGNAHFTVLDGHVSVDGFVLCSLRGLFMEDCFNTEQVAWLEADLEAAANNPDIDHIFVFTHIGPYSSKEGRTGNAHMRRLLGTFLNYGVTMIVSGHDHYYEHGLSSVGIPYIISGGGGAPLYDITSQSIDPHDVYFNESIHHYVLIEVVDTYVRVTAKTPDGRVLETFDLGVRPECIEDSECFDAPRPEGCEFGVASCVDYACSFDCPEPDPDPDPDDEPDVGAPDASPDADAAVTPDTSAPDAAPDPAADTTAEVGAGGDGAGQDATDESGCDCSATSSRSGLGLYWLAIAGAILAGARRRRTASLRTR